MEPFPVKLASHQPLSPTYDHLPPTATLTTPAIISSDKPQQAFTHQHSQPPTKPAENYPTHPYFTRLSPHLPYLHPPTPSQHGLQSPITSYKSYPHIHTPSTCPYQHLTIPTTNHDSIPPTLTHHLPPLSTTYLSTATFPKFPPLQSFSPTFFTCNHLEPLYSLIKLVTTFPQLTTTCHHIPAL